MQDSSTVKNTILQHPSYQEFSPCNVLAEYIQCYWVTTTIRRLDSISMTRVIPDGCIDLIFNLGDPFYHRSQDSLRLTLPSSFIVGVMRAARTIELAGWVDILGIRFKPGGAVPFFRVPAQLLTDRIVPMEDILNESASSIGDRLATEPTGVGKIAVLEDFLITQVSAHTHRDDALQQATSIIIETKGQIPIKMLETSLSISRRQLERKFLEAIGLSPKIFCRIIRMQYALTMLRRSMKPIWTDIVYTSGFYDQAHFIRECKSLIGLTPSAYLQEYTASSSEA